MLKPTYNHAFDIAFSLDSETADGSDVTGEMLRSALLQRLSSISDMELEEAAGAPFDSYQHDLFLLARIEVVIGEYQVDQNVPVIASSSDDAFQQAVLELSHNDPTLESEGVWRDGDIGFKAKSVQPITEDVYHTLYTYS